MISRENDKLFFAIEMAEKDPTYTPHTSFLNACYIWFEQAWRTMVLVLCLYAANEVSLKIFPVFGAYTNALVSDFPQTFCLLMVGIGFFINIHFMREALIDHYSKFYLKVESKVTGESLFALDNRLGLSTVLPICWAQFWRMMFLPAALYAGLVMMAIMTNENVAQTIYAMVHHGPFYLVTIILLVPYSLWTTYESLIAKYSSFRLTIIPKSFYSDVEKK